VGFAHQKKKTKEQEVGFARILKDSTFFLKKESGAKKTIRRPCGPLGSDDGWERAEHVNQDR